ALQRPAHSGVEGHDPGSAAGARARRAGGVLAVRVVRARVLAGDPPCAHAAPDRLPGTGDISRGNRRRAERGTHGSGSGSGRNERMTDERNPDIAMTVRDDGGRLGAVFDRLRRFVADGELPSAGLAVAVGAETVAEWYGGWAAPDRPACAETLWPLASI